MKIDENDPEFRDLALRIKEAERLLEEQDAEQRRLRQEILDRPIARLVAFNEQIKYTATLLNTIAAGCIVAGFIGPLAAFVAGTGVHIFSVVVSSIWLPIGVALHYWGVRPLLERLRE